MKKITAKRWEDQRTEVTVEFEVPDDFDPEVDDLDEAGEVHAALDEELLDVSNWGEWEVVDDD